MVLVCKICSKTFEKESTHKRHGFYCRSKQANPKVSRKRSCNFCIRRKTRCDSGIPRCSSCSLAGRECEYDGVSFENAVAKRISKNDVVGETMSIDSQLTDNHDCGFNFDSSHDDWNLDPFTVTPTWDLSPLQPMPQLELPVVGVPNLFRALPHRQLVKPQARTSSEFLLRLLGSYPSMLLYPTTPPPFIHPLAFRGETAPSGPLETCMRIVQMFEGRKEENGAFLWRSIRGEQERLWTEHTDFTALETLAAAQSLLVYLLMRLTEGETVNTDFDIPLLVSANAIFRALTRLPSSIASLNSSNTADWEDWMFTESRHRLMTVLQITNLLINIDNTIPRSSFSSSKFFISHLPASRALWEAADVEAWTTLRNEPGYGMTADGRLVALDGEREMKWEGWCASMDGFGPLLMIAATIL